MEDSWHYLILPICCFPAHISQVLVETIRTGVDVNTLDEETGNAPIHAIVSGRKRKDKVDLLLALLVYSKVDVNLPNRRNMTALHLAIEVYCFAKIIHAYCWVARCKLDTQMVAEIRRVEYV